MEGAQRAFEVATEADRLLLQLNNYEMSRKSLKRKLSKGTIISKPRMASVKQLRKKLSEVDDEKRLLEMTSEDMMKNYDAQNTVREKSVEKRAKIIPTHFFVRQSI